MKEKYLKMRVNAKERGKKLVEYLALRKLQLCIFMYALVAPVNIAYAKTADSQWNNFTNFIKPWITRMGGLVIVIGAIEFGMGWKDDDPSAKTKGVRTVIAGCIIFAVGLSLETFLA